MVGQLLQLADQLREQGRPLADHVLKVGRHLSRHRQQHVAVDVELVRELTRRFLRGGGDFAAFHFAEVGGLDAHTLCYLPDGVRWVGFPQLFAAGSDELAEVLHMGSVY